MNDGTAVSLKERLSAWAISCGTPHLHLNRLLSILYPYFPELPLDSRTLHYHFGIKKGIIQNLNVEQLDVSNVDILVGVDGNPTAKSNRGEFWPILGLIKNQLNSTPFLIGLYHGSSKPADVNDFLKDFIEEMKKFVRN